MPFFRSRFFFLPVICLYLIISCEQEPDPFADLAPKSPGRYLSAITWVRTSDPGDTLKYVELEYNEKRYLVRINFFDRDSQEVDSYYRLSYNTSGRISAIEKYYA